MIPRMRTNIGSLNPEREFRLVKIGFITFSAYVILPLLIT